MTPEYWLNLQKIYDLDCDRAGSNLDQIEPLVAAGCRANPAALQRSALRFRRADAR